MIKALVNIGAAIALIAGLSWLFFFVIMPFAIERYRSYVMRRRKYDKEIISIQRKDKNNG